MSFRQSVPGRKVTWAMRPELPSHWAVRQQWDCKRKADLEVRSHFNTCVELCKKSWHMRGTHTWSLCCLYSRDNSVTDYLCLPVSTHRGQAPCGGSCCMMGAQRTLCACNISVPLQKKKKAFKGRQCSLKNSSYCNRSYLNLKREAVWGNFSCGQHQAHNMQKWRRTVSMGEFCQLLNSDASVN